jgi:hypothetical protein
MHSLNAACFRTSFLVHPMHALISKRCTVRTCSPRDEKLCPRQTIELSPPYPKVLCCRGRRPLGQSICRCSVRSCRSCRVENGVLMVLEQSDGFLIPLSLKPMSLAHQPVYTVLQLVPRYSTRKLLFPYICSLNFSCFSSADSHTAGKEV